MRFLADENFPRLAVEALRGDGHDVSWVRTDAPGSSDDDPRTRKEIRASERLLARLEALAHCDCQRDPVR